MSTLYERLGGEMAVMAAVDLFYDKVLDDDRISHFFDGLEMSAQIKKQSAFMMRAFGGPEEFQGRDLRAAHAGLVRDKGLNGTHFDAVAEHLQSALQELGVGDDLVGEVLTIVASTRGAVLGE